MLFKNKLPTDLYSPFQIIKLLIEKESKLDTQQKYISTLYISNSINSSTTYISTSLYTSKKKNWYMISFYTQETSYMKTESKYCIMGSINEDKQ